MTVSPFEILCHSPQAPDLATSAFGPFVLHHEPQWAQVPDALRARAHDAVLLACASDAELDRLLAWPGLPQAAQDTALLVIAPEPLPGPATRLVQAGVQDVIALRDARPDMLARAVRLAIERKRLDHAARRAYSTDLTTGLPNHAQLLEHMTHLLALREREPASMAVIAVRIEGFTATDSALGAEAANVLRRKVAVRIRASLRASDVVASIGPDLFAVLLAWIDAPSDADGVARKLQSSLRQPLNVAGHDLAVVPHMGLSQYPIHGRDAGTLLRRAVGLASVGQVGRAPGLGGGAAANDDSTA